MSIAIVIPCISSHLKYIPGLLNKYANQTIIPEEVIISVSNGYNLSRQINTISKKSYPFELTIINNVDIKMPGENRQIGSDITNCDYIIFQDADDIPHKQRVEIMKYFFVSHNANYIAHLRTKIINKFVTTPYVISKISYSVWNKPKYSKKITIGNIGIKRNILDDIKWTYNTSDSEKIFTENVLMNYNNCIVLKVPLLLYRKHLSSMKILFNQT